MEEDLPYKVEYSKSNRASCKSCKTPIAKDVVRIARMVQSGFHDGKIPNWFHEKCFFQKFRPETIGDVAGFEILKYDDQERVKKSIAESTVVVKTVQSKGKGKKRGIAEAEIEMTDAAVKDFGIEYSSTSRATCRGCEQIIIKGSVRVKKISFDTEVGMKYGGQPMWHHLECFVKLRTELKWYSGANQLPGFNSLKKDDQSNAIKLMPPFSSDEIDNIKKLKLEPKDEVDNELESKLKTQNKTYHKYRDMLKESLKKSDLIIILKANKQEIPEGHDAALDATTDIITFGTLVACDKCQGQYVFNKANYVCTGHLSEWARCERTIQEPPRVPTKIPSDILEKCPGLPKKGKILTRAIKYIPPSVSNVKVKKEEGELEGPKVVRPKPPLYRMQFAIIGRTGKSKDNLKIEIERLGGKLVSKIHDQLAGIISTQKEIDRMNDKMEDGKTFGIQILPETFLDSIKELGPNAGCAEAIQLIKTMSLCDWGTDPAQRIPNENEMKSAASKSIYTKSMPKSVTLKLKDGLAVDPDSGLEGCAHVYVQGKTKYFAVLSKIDIQRDKNSYYKLQLLEEDNRKRYYVFRSWGRIGTKIGANKVENFSDVSEAIFQFNSLYQEQTGNAFGTKNFKKIPDRYCPIDVDYGEDQAKKIIDQNRSKIKSKLPSSVQDLMALLFDVEIMKKVMLDFDLDMEKMPLGKLSQKQLANALNVLNEIVELLRTGAEQSDYIGKSNHFYSLVPHDFGTARPTIIDNADLITAKREMIEALMEIEIAYGLLNAHGDDAANPLDNHYNQLKTELEPLNHDSDEFQLLCKYVNNTHAKTHSNFELNVIDIFKVARAGENRRYKPFKKLHNRKLLWHGSRLTNYAGILSHGLKIAPPEAPVTGYMFGKGIYFADMVSKSANYCCTNPSNNTGLMLLSEVACGDMEEFTSAKYVTSLPKSKHSTKGVGKTYPNPSESHFRDDGVEIPLGSAVTDKKIKSSLLYNEFIVYDAAQVNIQYLLRMDFKYKY